MHFLSDVFAFHDLLNITRTLYSRNKYNEDERLSFSVNISKEELKMVKKQVEQKCVSIERE